MFCIGGEKFLIALIAVIAIVAVMPVLVIGPTRLPELRRRQAGTPDS